MTKAYILDYLLQHRDEFAERYDVEEIGLFGSYARDEATESSDIDIFVKMKPDLLDMVGLKLKIEEDLNQSVDIVREHKHMKPFFLKMIQKDIVYV